MNNEVNLDEIPLETPPASLKTVPAKSNIESELRAAISKKENALSPESMHGKFVSFGKYKGERWTRVPVVFLRWCANQLNDPAKTLGLLELKRRGVPIQPLDMELSAHSVDRASLKLLGEWQTTKFDEEGIHSWLARISREAYDSLGDITFNEDDETRRSQDIEVTHRDMKFVFMVGRYYPVLKTITPND